jgi:hypothetical protein
MKIIQSIAAIANSEQQHPHMPNSLAIGRLKRSASGFTLLAGLSLIPAQPSIALDEATLLLLTDVPDPYTLIEQSDAGAIQSASTISQTGLTVPSLWWTDDQFGGKLLETWFAFPSAEGIPPRVDLVINQQVWSLYTYLERFAFMNRFGTATRDFGYNMRVFNRQRNLLAAYICDFPPIDAADAGLAAPFEATSESSNLPNCEVFLDASGQGGLQGVATPLGAGITTPGGIAQP